MGGVWSCKTRQTWHEQERTFTTRLRLSPSLFVLCLLSPPGGGGGGEPLPGMTEIVFRALSTLKVLSACRFPTLINSVNSL